MGTHEKLPSIGAMRSGAEFCLSWLRVNYWRPQRLALTQGLREASSTSSAPHDVVVSEVGVASSNTAITGQLSRKEEKMMTLTFGLCCSHEQVDKVLQEASYM